tara:strand:+ start:154 stop:765 length:612 start_codon:yes stop_codon:yes gene_type:complete
MARIMNLFPVPVYFENCNFDYTEEFEFLKKQPSRIDDRKKKKQTSADTFLLKKPELKRLKDWIEITLDTFVKNVYKSQTELYITQSWLNTIGFGGGLSAHHHPNSIISGVWYPEITMGQTPSIHFCNFQKSSNILLNVDDNNLYNSDTMYAPIQSGNLILFPSNLYHGVKPNTTDKNRYSLSFNTWTHSDLGSEFELTYCSTK